MHIVSLCVLLFLITEIQGVSLSPNINVQLELSTCHGMGMLFYWSAEDGSILTVQLNNGLVSVWPLPACTPHS